MLDRPGLKAYARQRLRGNWRQSIELALLYLGLTYLWDWMTPERSWWDWGSWLFALCGQFLIGFVTVGTLWCFLDLARRGSLKRETLLEPFGYFFQAAGIYILTTAAVLLGFLLLVVPGVVLLLGFSQCFFIMRDQPELSPLACITASWRLMRGHKVEYLVLSLSFIGWFLLGGLTWGLGYLYVYPYWYTTRGAYYHHLLSDSSDIG